MASRRCYENRTAQSGFGDDFDAVGSGNSFLSMRNFWLVAGAVSCGPPASNVCPYPWSDAVMPFSNAASRAPVKDDLLDTFCYGIAATFELNGFIFLICRNETTVCSVVICFRPLRRRDDKQNGPNRYGQQNRPGDYSAKSGQNPNQTPGQQTQNPNPGSQQGGGQQRDPRR